MIGFSSSVVKSYISNEFYIYLRYCYSVFIYVTIYNVVLNQNRTKQTKVNKQQKIMIEIFLNNLNKNIFNTLNI